MIEERSQEINGLDETRLVRNLIEDSLHELKTILSSGRTTDMGLRVGWTLTKQEESDKRKKVALAPESEMTAQDKGVARVVDETMHVELHKEGVNA